MDGSSRAEVLLGECDRGREGLGSLGIFKSQQGEGGAEEVDGDKVKGMAKGVCGEGWQRGVE